MDNYLTPKEEIDIRIKAAELATAIMPPVAAVTPNHMEHVSHTTQRWRAIFDEVLKAIREPSETVKQK